jgi:CBS domain-containing protein/anti-sigma regulatory factor (Ser/Thr protein kinase)
VSPDRASKTQEMVYEMKVGDVMTRQVITVRPKSPVSELRGILRQNRISGLPVVDEERLVGLISVEDFIKWLANKEDDCYIEHRMTRNVAILNEDDPLVLAIGKFEKTGLGRFPVVDRQTEKLVGIVTKGDVIEGLLKKLEVDYHEEEIHRYRASHIFEDIEADDTTLLFRYHVRGRDFKQAGTSSSRLRRTMKRLGIRPDAVRRVAIASYEAEMNLVVFTEGGEIRARVQPRSVLLEVEDAGPGIADVEKALQPGYSTAPEWVRELGFGAGMGLTNIQKSADTFEIHSGIGQGTLLNLAFHTDGGGADERGEFDGEAG